MNRAPILLIGFTKYNNQGIIVKTNFIVDSMTGNTLYADAGTKLTDVSTGLTAYLNALGDKGKTLNYAVVKDEKRTDLNGFLKVLGVYVRDKYPGNVGNWLTSGFDVQTFDGSTQVPAIPVNLKPKDDSLSGNALVTYDKADFAAYYEGRHWKQGETVPAGMTATSRTKKMLFNGMIPGSTYLFQVRARGTKGVSEWSQTVSWIVR